MQPPARLSGAAPTLGTPKKRRGLSEPRHPTGKPSPTA
jgi:hypothetical protein